MQPTGSELYLEKDKLSRDSVGEGVERIILGFDDNLMMTHVKFAKGAIGSIHHHPHRQVTYVESGSFEVFIGEEKRVLKAGDCFFIPPDTNHGVVALEDGSLVDVFTPARKDFLQSKE